MAEMSGGEAPEIHNVKVVTATLVAVASIGMVITAIADLLRRTSATEDLALPTSEVDSRNLMIGGAIREIGIRGAV
jgi:hypothetical protein